MKNLAVLSFLLLSSILAVGQTVKFGDPYCFANSTNGYTAKIPLIFDNIPPVSSISLMIRYNGAMNFISAEPIQPPCPFCGYSCNQDTIAIGWVSLTTPVTSDTVTNLTFEWCGDGYDSLIFLNCSGCCELSDSTGMVYNVIFMNKQTEWYSWNPINRPEEINFHIQTNDHAIKIENTEYQTVRLYNLLGRMELEDKLSPGANTIPFHKKGIFIITLFKDGAKVSRKIVL